MGLAHRGDLVQRAARETAAERRVDGRDAKRQAAGRAAENGGFLQGLQALAQLLDHGVKPLETQINPAPSGRLRLYFVLYLF